MQATAPRFGLGISDLEADPRRGLAASDLEDSFCNSSFGEAGFWRSASLLLRSSSLRGFSVQGTAPLSFPTRG